MPWHARMLRKRSLSGRPRRRADSRLYRGRKGHTNSYGRCPHLIYYFFSSSEGLRRCGIERMRGIWRTQDYYSRNICEESVTGDPREVTIGARSRRLETSVDFGRYGLVLPILRSCVDYGLSMGLSTLQILSLLFETWTEWLRHDLFLGEMKLPIDKSPKRS